MSAMLGFLKKFMPPPSWALEDGEKQKQATRTRDPMRVRFIPCSFGVTCDCARRGEAFDGANVTRKVFNAGAEEAIALRSLCIKVRTRQAIGWATRKRGQRQDRNLRHGESDRWHRQSLR